MIWRKGTALSSLLAITLLLAVPQLAGSVGTCREVSGCGAPESKCDPNLWKEYERRKKVAEELFKAAAEQRKTVKDEAAEFFKEQLIGMGEVSAVKGPPVYAAGKFKEMALKEAALTRSGLVEKVKYLDQSRAFGAVVEGAELGGLAGTALWMYILGEEIQQLNAEWADSEKMSAEAKRQLDKALEAFKADFNQREACEKDRQKLMGEERLADKARELMESWENNGNLYKDPSGQILDSGAAFKRAKNILSKSMSRMDAVPHMWLAADAGQQSSGAVTVTRDQLEAAIKEVDKGISLLSSGMNLLIQELAAQEDIDSKLQALL